MTPPGARLEDGSGQGAAPVRVNASPLRKGVVEGEVRPVIGDSPEQLELLAEKAEGLYRNEEPVDLLVRCVRSDKEDHGRVDVLYHHIPQCCPHLRALLALSSLYSWPGRWGSGYP